MYCYWITEKSHWHLQALYIGIQKQTHYIIAITPDGFGVSPWKELNLVTSSIIHMIGLGIFFSFFYSRELLFTENDKLGVSSDNRVELQLITQQYFHNWNTNNHITNLKEVKKRFRNFYQLKPLGMFKSPSALEKRTDSCWKLSRNLGCLRTLFSSSILLMRYGLLEEFSK